MNNSSVSKRLLVIIKNISLYVSNCSVSYRFVKAFGRAKTGIKDFKQKYSAYVEKVVRLFCEIPVLVMIYFPVG